jgi:hypothetical protein
MERAAAGSRKHAAGRLTLTDSERESRRATVRNAIATQRLEGLVVHPATIADLESYANGDLDLEEVRRRALARIEAERLRGMREGPAQSEPWNAGSEL